MLAIIITNLLKHDLIFSSNTFQGPFNADFAAAKASIVIISSSSNSSSCSRVSGSGSIVLVPLVLVVVKSCPGLVNANWGL